MLNAHLTDDKAREILQSVAGRPGYPARLATEPGTTLLLPTGAKLVRTSDGSWVLYGYAHDGGDVTHYVPGLHAPAPIDERG